MLGRAEGIVDNGVENLILGFGFEVDLLAFAPNRVRDRRIVGVTDGMIGIGELGQGFSSHQGRVMPAGLDGTDGFFVTRRALGFAHVRTGLGLQGMFGSVITGVLERGDRVGNGTLLKCRATEQPGRFAILPIGKNLLKDGTSLRRLRHT